jgi:hypothetical protein
MKKILALADITLDDVTKQRPVNDEVVARYAALIKDGVKFKPVDIVNDGKENYLWDGRHRWHAYRKLDKKYIPCSIEPGSLRDAIYFSFHANCDHGFPRQPGTAKEIILKMLADAEWSKQSPKEIAEWVGVTRRHVDKIIAEKKDATSDKVENEFSNNPDSELENEDYAQEETEKVDKPAGVILDSVGEVVPADLAPVFSRKGEIKLMIHQLNQMLKTVRDAQERNDPLWKYCKFNLLEVETNNVKRNLKFSIPYNVCRYCLGTESKNCRACNGLGFCNEHGWISTAQELKPKKE